MSKLPTELVKEILLIVPVPVLKKSYLVREMHEIMNSSSFWEQRNDSLSELLRLDFPPSFKQLETLVKNYNFIVPKIDPSDLEKKFLVHLSVVNPSLLRKFDNIYTWFDSFDYLLEVMPRYVKALDDYELMELQIDVYRRYRDNLKEIIGDRADPHNMQLFDISELDDLKHLKTVQDEIKLRLKN